MIGSVISKNGIKIRLTAERWTHIAEAHDYMAGNLDLVLETIEDPDVIVDSGKGELIAIKYYTKTSISKKDMVVFFKEQGSDGFVITSFMTSKKQKIMKKGIIWKRHQTS